MTRFTNLNFVGLGLSALLLQGCWWSGTPANDAGLHAWAAHVVPVVVGRKAKNGAEIRALADLAAVNGKAAVVRLLMEQPEYAEYWSHVVTDMLQTQRSGVQAAFQTCWDDSLIDDEQVLLGLAPHILRYGASVPYCERIVNTLEPHEPHEVEHEVEGREAGSGRAVEIVVEDWVPARGGVPDGYAPTSGDVDDSVPERRAPAVERSEAESEFGEEEGGEEGVAGRFVPITDPGECWDFTMKDVLRSAILNDDLSAVYVANLVPLSTFVTDLSGTNENSIRNQQASLMMSSYLNRDDACMSCHTSTFSTTDARQSNGHWDRFWAPMQAGVEAYGGTGAQLDLEGSAFSFQNGNSHIYRGNGGTLSYVRNNFRTDVHTASGGFRPWGMDESCASDPDNGFVGFRNHVAADSNAAAALGARDLDDSRHVLDLARALALGASEITNPNLTLVDPPDSYGGGDATQGAITFNGCLGCHDGSFGPDLDGIVDRIHPTKLRNVLLYPPAGMTAYPANGTPTPAQRAATDTRDIIAYLASPSSAHGAYSRADANVQVHAEPRQGFAHLVALNFTNGVVKEIQGYPMTIDHGFARVASASAGLDDLTDVMVRGGWSLQDLLVEVVTSESFGRRAPEDTVNMTYEMPMVANPWAAAPPTLSSVPAHLDANGQGDFVHRYSVPNLLMSVKAALGWPAPRLHGGSAAYPTMSVATEIGRYQQRSTREAVDFVDLPRFLMWEDEVADCEKPSQVFARDVHAIGNHAPDDVLAPHEWEDWIDVLVDTANPSMTNANFLGLIRDRLLGDRRFDITQLTVPDGQGGTISKNEQGFAADSVGVVANATITASTSLLEDQARGYCAVLLRSPQFMLSGIPTVTSAPLSTPQSICMEGPCSYNQFCDAYEDALLALGWGGNCDGTLTAYQTVRHLEEG